jgi:hypothetical protein
MGVGVIGTAGELGSLRSSTTNASHSWAENPSVSPLGGAL